jgi:murein DD-endopeptidase MepM/ murein hydrolase activator NlpD
MRSRPRLLRLTLLLLALVACQPAPALTPDAVPTAAPGVQPSGTLLVPSPVVREVALPTPHLSSTLPPTVAPLRTGDALRFTFPSPPPVPASRWRPPLYEVPWALGPYDHFFLTRPISADEVNWPEWDYRYGAVAEDKKLAHSGIDIAANRNTPVIAAGPGIVAWAGYGLENYNDDPNDPYGLAVLIEHDFGYGGHTVSTVYGHLDRIDVALGQRVVAGQQLGIVGTTGNSTGPHLHFEVRLQYGDYGATRNPELWLSPPQGWGVLVARLTREDTTPLYQTAVHVRSKATGQTWEVRTYGPNNIYFDDYYRENLVLSDLPAGDYQVSFDYEEDTKNLDVTIHPGGITYFTYRDKRGFSTALPALTPPPTNWLVTPQK